jgi:transglutaminase-like putative cysteine protease
MKNILILALIVLGIQSNYSQKHELGNVTIDELKEKFHPKDSSTVAAVLFEKGKTHFEYSQNEGFVLITVVEVKIKIYKKEGYDFANKSVRFYAGGVSKENVSFSKAVTYNLNNNQIEKTKLKSEGEFSENINKFWSRKKITMPNVKEGSIIEYKYEIKSPYISTFPEWSFQQSIPVNYSEYQTLVPEYYVYNVYRKGSLQPVEIKNSISKSVAISEKVLNINKGYSRENSTFNYSEQQIIYKLENIPALKEEAFVNNIDNYKTSVYHELSQKRLPQAVAEFYSATWEDVTKKIYENDDFGSQLNKENYFEEDLKIVVKDIENRDEKITAVLNYVQNRMNWNKYNSYSCDIGVKKAYQDKSGNAAEINLMMVAMLRHLGLDANPVLVSTRSNGISIFPSRSAFNFVIASVTTDNGIILLDATSKISSPNILPLYDLNWFGRMIRKDGTSELVDLMPKLVSDDVVNMLVSIDDQGQVSGKVREQYFDYAALNYRDRYLGLSKDSYLEKLEKRHEGLEVSDFELTNDKIINEPIIEKYSIKSNNLIEKIGDKLYFEPLLHLTQSENPFKQETREYPIDFSFPFKDKYMVNITIPQGYQVESLPKSASFAMANNYGSFNMTTSNTDTQVQVVVNFIINASIIPSEDYDTLKEFFKVIIDKQNEKIILKKI